MHSIRMRTARLLTVCWLSSPSPECTLPLCGQTDAYENITFPQLRFRAVIIDLFTPVIAQTIAIRIRFWYYAYLVTFYLPRSVASEGYVFTGVFHSFCPQGRGLPLSRLHHWSHDHTGGSALLDGRGGADPHRQTPPPPPNTYIGRPPPPILPPPPRRQRNREYGQWWAVRILLECILVDITFTFDHFKGLLTWYGCDCDFYIGANSMQVFKHCHCNSKSKPHTPH